MNILGLLDHPAQQRPIVLDMLDPSPRGRLITTIVADLVDGPARLLERHVHTAQKLRVKRVLLCLFTVEYPKRQPCPAVQLPTIDLTAPWVRVVALLAVPLTFWLAIAASRLIPERGMPRGLRLFTF